MCPSRGTVVYAPVYFKPTFGGLNRQTTIGLEQAAAQGRPDAGPAPGFSSTRLFVGRTMQRASRCSIDVFTRSASSGHFDFGVTYLVFVHQVPLLQYSQTGGPV